LYEGKENEMKERLAQAIDKKIEKMFEEINFKDLE
jgi:hypothetical protein